MNEALRKDAEQIIRSSLRAVQPDAAVRRALERCHPRGGRTVLAAAPGIRGISHGAVFSVGSDGTDGPTDAAGGYVDGGTLAALAEKGLDVYKVLTDNDAYHALAAVNGLIVTGPTGTNVNDVAVALLRP